MHILIPILCLSVIANLLLCFELYSEKDLKLLYKKDGDFWHNLYVFQTQETKKYFDMCIGLRINKIKRKIKKKN